MVRVAMVQSWEEEPWYVAIASERTNSTRNLAHIDEAAVTRRTTGLGLASGLGLELGSRFESGLGLGLGLGLGSRFGLGLGSRLGLGRGRRQLHRRGRLLERIGQGEPCEGEAAVVARALRLDILVRG